MARYLGVDLSITNLKPYFENPVSKTKVHIELDEGHMLKLVRNTLGDWKIIFDKNMEPIQWIYFEQLVDMQKKNTIARCNKNLFKASQLPKSKDEGMFSSTNIFSKCG